MHVVRLFEINNSIFYTINFNRRRIELLLFGSRKREMLEHIIDLPSPHTRHTQLHTHGARARENGTPSRRASHNYCIMNKRRNERMKKRREPAMRGRLIAGACVLHSECGCYRVCCAVCTLYSERSSRFTCRIYFSCFLRQFNLALGGLGVC